MWYKIKFWITRNIGFYVKILPLLGLVFFLAATWFYFESIKNHSDEELHALLQDQVQVAISDYVDQNTKDISSIVFHKLWTKPVPDSDDVRVFFSYSLFSEEGETEGEILIDGEALLIPLSEEKNNWKFTSFKVNNSFVDFAEPLVIRPLTNF